MAFLSTRATWPLLDSRRLRRLVFLVARCVWPWRLYTSLPAPVRLKRLDAAFLVLILGTNTYLQLDGACG